METDVFLPPQPDRRDDSGLLVGLLGHTELKIQVKTSQDNVRIVKGCGPHFGVSSEIGVSH